MTLTHAPAPADPAPAAPVLRVAPASSVVLREAGALGLAGGGL